MTKNQKLNLMGKIVEVNKIYNKTYDNKNNLIYTIKSIEPKLAWITGFGNIVNGTIDSDGEFNHFIPVKTIPCIKIKFFYKDKETKIPFEGFVYDPNNKSFPLENKAVQDDKIEFYRKQANTMKRDAKGHFLKQKQGKKI